MFYWREVVKFIAPHKLKPLNKDILVVSAFVLKHLKANNQSKLSILLESARDKLEIEEKHFLYSLNLLFVFNKIKYDQKMDTLELI